MARELDKRISIWAESAARRLTRRRTLALGIKGGFAAIAGVVIGQGLGLREAEAACTCYWAGGNVCSGCPAGTGCPSGWTRCRLGDPPVDYRNYGCCGWCKYASGSWVSCTGLGYGYGYKVCTDCKNNCACPNIGVCTCLSPCICCLCSAPVSA